MITWSDVLDRYKYLEEGSQSRKSYYRSLVLIFEKAEEWGFDPECVNSVTQSNLLEIVHEARLAALEGRVDRLKELFGMARDLSYTNLVIELRGDRRDLVVARRVIEDGREKYLISLNLRQLRWISMYTSKRMQIVVEDEP